VTCPSMRAWLLTLLAFDAAGAWQPSARLACSLPRGMLSSCRAHGLPTMQHQALPSNLAAALRQNGIEPNALQRQALDVALRGLDVIVHAETGSGKTLCYALPVLARLSSSPAGPESVVLVPTLELAAQVARVFNTLSPGSATALSHGIDELPGSPVVIGPPAMMLRLMNGPTFGSDATPKLSRTVASAMHTVVLDEADALLMPLSRYATHKDRMLREEKPKEGALILEQLCATRGEGLQVLAASATVGRPLRRMVSSLCDGRTIEVVRGGLEAPMDAGAAEAAGTTSGDGDAISSGDDANDLRPLGRAVGLPSSISVTVVTSDASNVLGAVNDVLRVEAATAPLLFIAAGRSLQAEIQLLKSAGLDAFALDTAVLESSAPLAASSAATAAASAGPISNAASPRVLVASPSGARGLDLPAVDLVLVLGMPPSVDSFVHMAGRTGRQGASGRVAILTTPAEADAKLPLMSSQLGMDLGAERRHVAERDEGLAEMWAVHSKRYERPDAEPFYANRPRGRRQAAAGHGRRKPGTGPIAKKPGRSSSKARRRSRKSAAN